MKKNLGKIIILLLLVLHVELFASTYEWTANANKIKAYVNEPIHLKYTCSFDDRGELYTIDFDPAGHFKKYSVITLTENEMILDGKRINNYEFIVFTKEAGEISFEFPMLMKKTSLESIVELTGGRDNDREKEQFFITKLKQKPLHVEILETSSKLVGDFELSIKKDDFKVKSFEPYHMEVIIKGNGNFDDIKPIVFKIPNVKIFVSEIIKKIKLTKDGYAGVWSQKFAFVSDKGFNIPELDIEYFSLKQQAKKALHVEGLHIEVSKGYEKKELLDEVDEDLKINYEYIYYLLFFVAGFLVSKVKFKNTAKVDIKEQEFKQKLHKCKNMDEIMFLLLVTDRNKYKNIIKRIENKEYKSVKSVISDIS